MRQILQESIPGIVVSTSSEVLPDVIEHERISTTDINAALAPLVGRYASRLGQRMADGGYPGDVLLLHSGGGVMTPAMAEHWAARLAGSGIAAGAIAARHIAQQCGFANAISLDMGGTSTDISLIADGQVRVTNDWFVEYGYPIKFPSLDVLTIGAGGGSLAWVDEAGSIKNGPQSAGAVPGPVCYGKGGTEPTNTDASVVLGRLGPALLGGQVPLDVSLAKEAIASKIGAPLGLSVEQAADAIVRVAEANMADAVRVISIRRGHDPRDFVLVAFGGAGPLHAAALARELDVPLVIVPPSPGVTSALGCLMVDVRHDMFSLLIGKTSALSAVDVEGAFVGLEAEATRRLDAEQVNLDDRTLIRGIDMRYVGQWRSISVPVPPGPVSLEKLTEQFHAHHAREHEYSRVDAEVEVYRVTITAIGATLKATLPSGDESSGNPEPIGQRSVHFGAGEQASTTPIFARDSLRCGDRLVGPAVVDQLDSTIVIPPGADAKVDEWLNVQIDVGVTG
jgi:N-methylhydantoinase A